jgi:hypothetical protein
MGYKGCAGGKKVAHLRLTGFDCEAKAGREVENMIAKTRLKARDNFKPFIMISFQER